MGTHWMEYPISPIFAWSYKSLLLNLTIVPSPLMSGLVFAPRVRCCPLVFDAIISLKWLKIAIPNGFGRRACPPDRPLERWKPTTHFADNNNSIATGAFRARSFISLTLRVAFDVVPVEPHAERRRFAWSGSMAKRVSEVCVHEIVQRHRSTYEQNFFNMIIDGCTRWRSEKLGIERGGGERKWKGEKMRKNME